MLERTAASLEPYNLQRVLPSTSTSLKSHRRLHTTFWNHGAADLELSNAWQALVRGPMDAFESLLPGQPRSEPMTASTFLLDFLYPNGAVALLKRLSPSILDRYDRPRASLRAPGHRPYTSTAVSHEQPSSDSRNVLDERILADHMSNTGGLAHGGTSRDELYRLLRSPQKREFDRVWALWQRVDHTVRAETFAEVALYLAQSTSITEAGRISQLLASVAPSQLDNRLIPLAVNAELKLDNASKAAKIFMDSRISDQVAVISSLIPLIVYSFKTSSWGLLHKVWAHLVEAGGIPVLGASHLQEVASTPQLDHKLLKLYQIAKAHGVTDAESKLFSSLKEVLLNPLVGIALRRVQPKQAQNLLRRAKDPLLYEELIRLRIGKGQKSGAAQAYREYRELPNVKVRVPILHALVRDVFYPHDAAGMELVLKDWYQRYDRLDLWGYQKFLAFYASRGDVASVRRLWEEHRKYYPLSMRASSDDTFAHLLHVHAVRGDIGEVERVFNEIHEEYGVRQSTSHWNILLNAYSKARDYDGAINVFSKLCEASTPDHISFGTIMGLSGSRGDLECTLELYRMAKSRGVEPTVAMADGLVEAYCQNDALSEAESICLMITKNVTMKGDYTELWNTLLFHHAMRRDLVTVNRILNSMTELGVDYNDKTFEFLLTALVYAKQAHHGLKLLRVANEQFHFRPTYTHYIILMSAFLETKQPHMVLETDALLDLWGFPETSDRLLRVIQALGRYHEFPSGPRRKEAREYLTDALRRFRQAVDEPEPRVRPSNKKAAELSSAEQLKTLPNLPARFDQISLLIFLFAQAKDFVTTRELIEMWNSSSADTLGVRTLLRMLSAIMYANFAEGNLAEVKKLWTTTFDEACKAGRPRASTDGKGKILPLYHYVLVDPIKTMQRAYEADNDAEGILSLVSTVTDAGFKLDSKTWNYHVQALARLKKLKEAFTACEHILMPQWSGWRHIRVGRKAKNQLPLWLRRVGSSPKYLRPTSYTLLVLARRYMELEQMTAWSGEASRLYSWLGENCAQVVNAIEALRKSDYSLGKLDVKVFKDLEASDLARLDAEIFKDLDVSDLDLDMGDFRGRVRAELGESQDPKRDGELNEEAERQARELRAAESKLDEALTSRRV
ncbi:hypothetical protein NKR23_g4483 [Pleurostoma richardsiae]|uniref:CoxI translation protein CYA5 n=1 Tax=Pleurostoma richardsiae TaxID=41990 RepID=A0AA38RUV5_9PEZI|nr:hypothetical protein NKR23_g4483 [Pleurostoma richardsiae]